jgi:hypothetical protein
MTKGAVDTALALMNIGKQVAGAGAKVVNTAATVGKQSRLSRLVSSIKNTRLFKFYEKDSTQILMNLGSMVSSQLPFVLPVCNIEYDPEFGLPPRDNTTTSVTLVQNVTSGNSTTETTFIIPRSTGVASIPVGTPTGNSFPLYDLSQDVNGDFYAK